uniref:Xylanolytic transcriptional activator regulatory domain-containing protein n=1 Tax=Bionectria ochroleuca TaxID=29856 RepID=A0A0B7KK61_BIOOC
MQWTPLGPNEEVDISNLPHRDHTLFLIGAAKFYLNNYLGLIDEPEFTKGVYELYEGPAEKANSSRTWYAHFLLVLAYGKAYSKGNNSKGPPGSHYALRAMTMLPDMSGLYADPVLAVQTLTLASMWFQSVDMRIAAYYHISQAMRTCIMEGMHRHMPEQIVGAKQSKRACVAFWAIYTMEKEFSSSIGAPSALQDEAITAKPPSQMNSSVDAVNMELHCVVLSTRPLVMCALQMHVENSDTFPPVVVPLTSTVASLLSSCVESAHTILNMLRSLDEEGLLDSFLPFQLDAAYSSAFILHLIKLISPSLLQDQSWPHDIEYIFDRMIASGSVVAPVRKLELQQLENAMAALIPSTEQSWGLAPRAGYVQEQNFATDDYFRDPFWHTIASNGVSGLLPQEILDLADRLDVEDVASTSSQ